MDLKLDIGSGFQNLPATASMVVGFAILIFGIWFKIKESDAEEEKNTSDIRIAQFNSLLEHIKLLSTELDKTRKQLSELHLQNIELMVQLREANKRISELEVALTPKPYLASESSLGLNNLAA